jgi:hypothetical protein
MLWAVSQPVAAWWESGGSRLVWLAGVVVAVGVLAKTRPMRWLWRTLVTDPLSAWGRSVVGEVVDEKVALPNGGSSLRDHLDRMAQQHTDMKCDLEAVRQWTEEAVEKSKERDEALEGRFDEVNGRIDQLCEHIGFSTNVNITSGRRPA